MATITQQPPPARFFDTKRGRRILENLTAYLFLLPAGIVLFLFHIFPVGFAVYVSLFRWRRFPEEYRGLDNYQRALGDFAYVVFTWIALGMVIYAIVSLYRLWRNAAKNDEIETRLFIIPGLFNAAAVILFIRYFFMLLPVVLDVPVRIRGQELSRELFVGEFFASFRFEGVYQAGNVMLGAVLLAGLVSWAFWRGLRRDTDLTGRRLERGKRGTGRFISFDMSAMLRATMAFTFIAGAFFIFELTFNEINEAVDRAQAAVVTAQEQVTTLEGVLAEIPESDTDARERRTRDLERAQVTLTDAEAYAARLPFWAQIQLTTLGVALIVAGFLVWRQGTEQQNNVRFFMQACAAIGLLLGGYLMIAELPQMIANADDELWNGFRNTVFFSFTAVPVQLIVGMVLAYMLFQNIKGRSIFRLIYFMPYIMPFVATSAVFRILFSHNDTSPVNRFIGTLGIEAQRWLLEPRGITQLLFPEAVGNVAQSSAVLGDWLAGPSLALLSIIFYSMWTYIGYSAVIFLAGLGNIPGELYEVARIDGANRWHEFRHITFPLLSPTTFFLSIIAVIGTFKAFAQIYIMRSPSASNAVETASIYIFDTLRTETQYGYGSAMSFVLFAVILALTLFQNRYMGRRVFYG